jgi:hypothetical protein
MFHRDVRACLLNYTVSYAVEAQSHDLLAWIRYVHQHHYKAPSLFIVVSHFSEVRILITYFREIHFNIIFAYQSSCEVLSEVVYVSYINV